METNVKNNYGNLIMDSLDYTIHDKTGSTGLLHWTVDITLGFDNHRRVIHRRTFVKKANAIKWATNFLKRQK